MSRVQIDLRWRNPYHDGETVALRRETTGCWKMCHTHRVPQEAAEIDVTALIRAAVAVETALSEEVPVDE